MPAYWRAIASTCGRSKTVAVRFGKRSSAESESSPGPPPTSTRCSRSPRSTASQRARPPLRAMSAMARIKARNRSSSCRARGSGLPVSSTTSSLAQRWRTCHWWVRALAIDASEAGSSAPRSSGGTRSTSLRRSRAPRQTRASERVVTARLSSVRRSASSVGVDGFSHNAAKTPAWLAARMAIEGWNATVVLSSSCGVMTSLPETD